MHKDNTGGSYVYLPIDNVLKACEDKVNYLINKREQLYKEAIINCQNEYNNKWSVKLFGKQINTFEEAKSKIYEIAGWFSSIHTIPHRYEYQINRLNNMISICYHAKNHSQMMIQVTVSDFSDFSDYYESKEQLLNE